MSSPMRRRSGEVVRWTSMKGGAWASGPGAGAGGWRACTGSRSRSWWPAGVRPGSCGEGAATGCGGCWSTGSGEREFWKVEAACGEQGGLYELCHEPADESWTLLRAW